MPYLRVKEHEMYRFALLIISLFWSTYMMAQLNISVGYGFSYFGSEPNNQILAQFNEDKMQELEGGLVKPFSDLTFAGGINLGLRYQYTSTQALEIGWQSLSTDKEAVGETIENTLFSQKLFYSNRQFFADYHLILENWGAGIGLGIDRFRIQDEIANSGVKKVLVNESRTCVRLRLAYYFNTSRQVSFSIQPYVHIPLQSVSLAPLADELNVDTPETEANFMNFGIRLVFYNGPRN